jgi:hypothetical protein
VRTPRTVDEIADAILPLSIDGIHERALCLLLAEHEADIARLREQLPKLPPGEWTREKVAEFNASPAPGSTTPAPTQERVDQCLYLLGTVSQNARWLPDAIDCFVALAADRDRLKRELAASDRALVYECNRLEAERDALARRLDEMARREPTEDEVKAFVAALDDGNEGWSILPPWRCVRDALLATPASECRVEASSSRVCGYGTKGCERRPHHPASDPLTEPRCGLATASEPSEGPKKQRMVGFNEGPSTPVARLMPQPSPATPPSEREPVRDCSCPCLQHTHPCDCPCWAEHHWPATPSAESGISWGGFNLRGDAKSIAEVDRLMHGDAIIATLRRDLADARAQLAKATEEGHKWRDAFRNLAQKDERNRRGRS